MEAGIEELGQRFSSFLSLDIFAAGDPLKYNAILKLSANTMLRKIEMERARTAYARRLSRLKSTKK